MNNFLEFIEKDIDAKKTLISTLPTRTKVNKKKFNENIRLIKDFYKNHCICYILYIDFGKEFAHAICKTI